MAYGVWQGVTMDDQKLHAGPLCSTLLRPALRLTAVSGMARPQGGRPAAVYHAFERPMSYAYEWGRWK
jgi:hypothetical protein